MSATLHGVLSAIVTPFAQDGSTIDEAALRRLVDAQIDDGVSGIVVAGGTGEFWTLSTQERHQLVEIVTDQVAGRVAVMAQSGGNSTAEAIAYSQHAQSAGVDVLMVALPYYDPLDFDLAADYFRDVAASVDLPLCAYNYPTATGLNLSPEFLVPLARELPQLQYVKDSSADAVQLETFVREHADDLTVLNGEDLLLTQALLIGTKGMVMGIPNFVAPALVRAQAAADAGDAAGVVGIWQQLRPLFAAFLEGNYVSHMKAALEILGHPVGTVRAPFKPLTRPQYDRLATAIAGLDDSLLTTRG